MTPEVSGLPCLDKESTLGQIVLAWRDGGSRHSSFAFLDERFGQRHDYQCWRYLDAIDDPSSVCCVTSEEALTCGLDAGEAALLNDCAMVRWGGIGALVRYFLLSEVKYDIFPKHHGRLVAIAKSCASLAKHPTRLEVAPAASAYLDLLSQHALDKFRHWRGQTNSCGAAKEYVKHVEFCVNEIDLEWIPGASASLNSFRKERIILPFDGMIDVSYHFANALYQSRAVVRDATDLTSRLSQESENIELLIRKSVLHARSAWLTNRSERLHAIVESKRMTDRGLRLHNRLSSEKRAKALDHELHSLFRFGQASRDIGDYLTAAKANWMVLQFVARQRHVQSAQGSPELRWLTRTTIGIMRQSLDQLGLSVPDRDEAEAQGQKRPTIMRK